MLAACMASNVFALLMSSGFVVVGCQEFVGVMESIRSGLTANR
jgi:hypothetical protein